MRSVISFLLPVFIYAAFGVLAIIWMVKRKKAGKPLAIWARIIIVLIAGLSGVSLFAYLVSPPSEPTNSSEQTFYVKSGGANVRECPSTSCKALDTLSPNTKLTFPGDLFDKYPDWAEITFSDGKLGYVNKTTLSSELPIESPPQGDGIALGTGNFEPLIVGNSYGFSFCVPETARSGATCGGLAGDTQSPVGGSPPYSLMKGSGFFPPGMSLELNGWFFGSPTTAGTYNFQICAKDLQMNQGCQSYTIVVKKEATSPANGGTIGTADLNMTIDSITCVLAYQDDYDRLVFNVSMSGTARGPVGTYLSFWSSPPDDERYKAAEPYSILAGIHAEVNSGSWTEQYRDRTYSNKRAKGDPATTSWEIRGQTVHLYNASVQNSTMTRVNVSIRDESAVPTNEIKLFKDVACSL